MAAATELCYADAGFKIRTGRKRARTARVRREAYVGVALFWGLLKTAATNIPWTKVAENAPLLVDALGKAKARIRLNESSQKNLEEHLKSLQDENARLAADLLQLSKKVQLLTSRVALLSKITGFSLLCAVAALVLWMLK